MMRSMVLGALEVCSVPKTRCPVSAAVSASEMVSRSRISPIRITSGSSRSALRSALVNDPVCGRSEEHTSELQSLAYLVCRLLLEKKKKFGHHVVDVEANTANAPSASHARAP